MLDSVNLEHFKRQSAKIGFVYFEVIVGMSSVALQLYYLSRVSGESATAAILSQPFIITIFTSITALCYAVNTQHNLKKRDKGNVYFAGLILILLLGGGFSSILYLLPNILGHIYQLNHEIREPAKVYLSYMSLYVFFYALRQYIYAINVNQEKPHFNTFFSVAGIGITILILELLSLVGRLTLENLICVEIFTIVGIILANVCIRRTSFFTLQKMDVKHLSHSCKCISFIALPSMLEPAIYELSQLVILKILSTGSPENIQVYGYANTLFLCAIAWSVCLRQLCVIPPNR